MPSDVIEYVEGGTRVRVEGLQAIVRRLGKVTEATADMRDLMHDLGMIVVTAAQPPRRSGALGNSIRAGRGKTKSVVRAGGARAPYAGVVHYGWPVRNIRPQPFLTTALANRKNTIYAALEKGIDEILQKTDLK